MGELQPTETRAIEQDAARAMLRLRGVDDASFWDDGDTWLLYGVSQECGYQKLWVCPSPTLQDAGDRLFKPSPLSPHIPMVEITNGAALGQFMIRCVNLSDDTMYELFARLYRQTPGTVIFEA